MLNSGLFVCRQIEPDVTVMDFTGRLTTPAILVADVERYIKKRIERGIRKLVLDLGKVDLIDSSAVGMLVVCSSAMEQAGGNLVIAGAAGYVKRVLELVHVDRTIPMYSDLPAACKAMTAPTGPPAAAQ
jgi:anti-anti-sigma factor